MTIRPTWIASLGAVSALLALGACAKQELPPRSAVELMDDPVLLQVVLDRCNQSASVRDRECSNAREAVERLAAGESEQVRQQKQAAVQAEFEKAREERRRREALERHRQETQQAVDPYTMPLVKEPDTAPMQGSTAQAGAAPPT
jgi:hypothetical protein